MIENIEKIDFAFQPIVNIKSGETFAVEALIRNTNKLGFTSIFEFFDKAYEKGILYKLDLILREKAIEKFLRINIRDLKLFYNLDNRVLLMPDYEIGNTKKILKKFNLSKERFVFELSERGSVNDPYLLQKIINLHKKNNYKLAIDDFGTGIAGMQLLYYAESNFIKIDRFFIQDIQKDSKKRLFCSHIVDMAHIMGMRVIAEGVETKEEFFICKKIGVDFIQGYLIQKPEISYKLIKPIYKEVKELFKNDLRNNEIILEKKYIQEIEPICIDNLTYESAFNYFKKYKESYFIPIINKSKEAKGILYEKDIRDLIFSPYGMSIAKNEAFKDKLHSNIKNAVSVESSWDINKILEVYNVNRDKINYGIFVTTNNKYIGFLSLRDLLHLSFKKNLQLAENINPLTKLPGNTLIDQFLVEVFEKEEKDVYYLVYFDFNNFKPFNDVYGFRKGDRAILLFSEILKKYVKDAKLIAHIGGDDFFVGFKNIEFEKVYEMIKKVQEQCKLEVESLYSEEDRKRGCIKTRDRYGIEREFDLLSVSAAIIEIKQNVSLKTFEEKIGDIKKLSKKVSFPLAISLRRVSES
ncbi:MAG TPA: GGDEF domain-containing protein [Nautiliaceae bacterium]|nr:GGDEF domain-containing protein [Nautiliaceae bacterium]